ncbi:hypothetical protein WDW37_18230, partial [Bdellovibrionota bacterium FG-1]
MRNKKFRTLLAPLFLGALAIPFWGCNTDATLGAASMVGTNQPSTVAPPSTSSQTPESQTPTVSPTVTPGPGPTAPPTPSAT